MAKGNKITPEIALKEVNKWLEFKRVSDTKRKENEDGINKLAEAIACGDLSLSENMEFIQELKFPLTADDNSIVAEKLTYKPRLKMKDIRNRTKHVKSDDSFGLIAAYVSALTGLNSGVVDELDSEDNRIAQSIAIFFL